jgi:hypothetical protein
MIAPFVTYGQALEPRTCVLWSVTKGRRATSSHDWATDMTFNRTTFMLFAVFWAAIVSAQFYFLYRKFEAVQTCRLQHAKLDTMQTQVDQLKALMNRGAGR